MVYTSNLLWITAHQLLIVSSNSYLLYSGSTTATGQIFSRTTQALFYNYKRLPIQRMLDFDFLCGRETTSVAGIINPGAEGFQKLFFGQEEIAIPVHSSIEATCAAHPTADVFINFASFRRFRQIQKFLPMLFCRSHENADITLLNQLDVSKVNVTIKVRLIKVWKQPSYKITNATHSMECILMDEEFTKIQATIMNTYLIKHEKFLLEGECVLITRFDVGDNLSTYRLTNHAHRLFLKFETVIMKCNDTVGTPRGFLFTEFDVLRNNALPVDFVVDVIGYVETYFDMYEHKTKKGELMMELGKKNVEKKSLSRAIFIKSWFVFETPSLFAWSTLRRFVKSKK